MPWRWMPAVLDLWAGHGWHYYISFVDIKSHSSVQESVEADECSPLPQDYFLRSLSLEI